MSASAIAAVLIPAFAPELSLEFVVVDPTTSDEVGVEVSLTSVLLAVVDVVEEDEVVVVSALVRLELVDDGLELKVVELVELEELVVLAIGRPSPSHSGEMQNHSRSVTASTGTVWPTPAADTPTSFKPSPYTILV